MSFRFQYLLALLCTISTTFAMGGQLQFNIAILGFGARAHILLLECLKLQKEANVKVNVLAICDNNIAKTTRFYINRLYRYDNEFAANYEKLIKNATFYKDNDKSLKKLFSKHKNINKILITSENFKHAKHLNAVLEYSSCRNIFMEKPLFRTSEELSNLNPNIKEAKIDIGLTLRSSNMTRIILENLNTYKSQLGQLQKVKSWEHVNFGHAFVRIMMNWRKYISLSGGLLLEKSIHDLDLALFFIKSLGIDVSKDNISINTQASHKIFKKSQKDRILKEVLKNGKLRGATERWDNWLSKRILKFAYDKDGEIDWQITLDEFFEDFPEDDDFSDYDIIPDYQKLTAVIKTVDNKSIDYELEVDLTLNTETDRGIDFEFEKGTIKIDVMKSKMIIKLGDGTISEIDLETKNNSHADGDKYIAQIILDALDKDQYKATFNDEIVQLATKIALESEGQVKTTL